MLSQRVRENIKSAKQSLLRTDLLVLFFIALSIRLLLFGISLGQGGMRNIIEATPDSVLYLDMAQSVLDGTNDYEHGFFIFGPGYAFFLALCKIVFSGRHILMILFQTVLSSCTATMVFLFSKRLTNSYSVSLTAAYLFALSWTSISLSQMFLAETAFLFTFLLALLFYLRALETHSTRMFVLSGIITGASLLIKPIAQFWAVPLLFYAAVFSWSQLMRSRWRHRFSLLKMPLITVAIIALIASAWLIRNYQVHGIATLSFASAGGPFNTAAYAMELRTGQPYRDIEGAWLEEHRVETGRTKLTREQVYLFMREKTKEIILAYPADFLKAHLSLVWENINGVNYLPRALFPDYKGRLMYYDNKIREYNLQYINFYVCLAGLLCLLLRKEYRSFWVLVTMYAYFALLIGFTRWQGSRLFMPGQLAAVVLISTALWSVAHWVAWVVKRSYSFLTDTSRNSL